MLRNGKSVQTSSLIGSPLAKRIFVSPLAWTNPAGRTLVQDQSISPAVKHQ